MNDDLWYLTHTQKQQAKALEAMGWCLYRRWENGDEFEYVRGIAFDQWKFYNHDEAHGYAEAVCDRNVIFSFCTEWKTIGKEYPEAIALAKSGFKNIVRESKIAIERVNLKIVAPQLALPLGVAV